MKFYFLDYILFRKKNETISSIIKRAGGLTSLAYPDGASLKRIYIDPVKDKKVDTIIDYSVNQARINDFVGIDLKNILEKPGSIQDLYLQEGDIILIPKQLQTISIKGQVFSPVTTAYVSNKSFKFYISSAGGFTPKANRKRSYVKYANGKTVSTKKFLFLNIYPKLKPGSEIFIPDNPNNTPLSITELVSVTSSILTLYLLITKL